MLSGPGINLCPYRAGQEGRVVSGDDAEREVFPGVDSLFSPSS